MSGYIRLNSYFSENSVLEGFLERGYSASTVFKLCKKYYHVGSSKDFCSKYNLSKTELFTRVIWKNEKEFNDLITVIGRVLCNISPKPGTHWKQTFLRAYSGLDKSIYDFTVESKFKAGCKEYIKSMLNTKNDIYL